MEQKSKKKNTIKTIVGLVVGFLVMILVQQFTFDKPTFDKVMMESASELNKSCPVMVDKDTRLDNVIALPDNIFQYNYTLVNIEKKALDIKVFTDYLEPTIVNNVKTNPDLKIYRDNKTTLVYYYKDMNGKFITKIDVTKDKYLN